MINAIKFDSDKIEKLIDAYYVQNGEYPYLICSEDTAALFVNLDPVIRCKNGSYITTEVSYPRIKNEYSISFGDTTISTKPKIDYGKYHYAKVLIDNDLPYGMVHVG